MKKENKLRLKTSLLLASLLLTGCTNRNKYTQLQYETNEEGDIELTEEINYNNLVNYKFIVVDNQDYNILEYYLASKKEWTSITESLSCYHDIFTGKNVLNEIDTSILEPTEEPNYNWKREKIAEINIEQYLLATGYIKEKYTKKELELILENMKDAYIEMNNIEKDTQNKSLKKVKEY